MGGSAKFLVAFVMFLVSPTGWCEELIADSLQLESPVIGDPQAPLAIVEFVDYQ